LQLCKECFYTALEDEVHQTILKYQLFYPGEVVALGASGGKDSTVLAHMMNLLNKRHKYGTGLLSERMRQHYKHPRCHRVPNDRSYGLNLWLLSIDEGISGYRDDSLETVKRNELQYGLPLKIVAYKDLYGWTMDEIVRRIGTKNNCTFCGVFRRQALDRGAVMIGATKVATGHNADDIAETVLLNLLRGDLPRWEYFLRTHAAEVLN
jgi:cytoplasmic tRNA 2-thiolation protein 1